MSESTMRSKVVKILKELGLDGIPVENPCCPGTPDINFAGGWIECKKHRGWPVDENRKLVLHHDLMPSQKIWIKRRWKITKDVYVMIQVGKEFVLLDGMYAILQVGEVTRSQILEECIFHCYGWAELRNCLSRKFVKCNT